MKPATSAPAKDMPQSASDSSMGTDRLRCFQLAMLSPVQAAPCRWEPAKKLLVSTKGRTSGARRSWPKVEASCTQKP